MGETTVKSFWEHIGELLEQNASAGPSLGIIGHSLWCLIVHAGKSCLDQLWDNFKITFYPLWHHFRTTGRNFGTLGTTLEPPATILALCVAKVSILDDF